MESNKPEGSCTNGAIIARAIGVVNNSYVSELNVTVNLEMNNTTLKCVHSYNLTETVVKEINITVISPDNSQNPHPTDAQLIKVSNGELTFNWNSSIKYCNGYFIESNDCGICPNETYDTHITCKNVSSVSNLCSFTVGTSTSNGTWTDQVNITLRGKINYRVDPHITCIQIGLGFIYYCMAYLLAGFYLEILVWGGRGCGTFTHSPLLQTIK